jgi:hypothetical protein
LFLHLPDGRLAATIICMDKNNFELAQARWFVARLRLGAASLPLLFSLLLLSSQLLLCSNAGWGQSADVEPISTDRPSVATGPDLVPVHSIQFENGASWTRDQGSSAADGPQTEVRFGLSRRVELQATLPNLHWSGAASGFQYDDLSLGTKLKIGSENRGWPLALVGSISLPSGSPERTSGGVDPTILLATEHNLPHNLQISGSANLASLSTNGGARVAQSQMALDMDWCARATTCIYAEGAPFVSTAQNANGYTIDGGLSLRIAPLIQLDGSVGTTVLNGDHAFFATIGYSFRRDPRR